MQKRKIKTIINVLLSLLLLSFVTDIFMASEAVADKEIIETIYLGTSKWELWSDGILEVSEGVISDDQSILIENRDLVKKIIIRGTITLNKDYTGLFAYYPELESIEGLELIDLSETDYLGYMFFGDRKLTKLDLSSWDVSNITAITGMIMNSGVEDLDIHTWNMSNIVQGSSALMNYYNGPVLHTLKLGEKFTQNTTIAHDMYLPIIEEQSGHRYTGNWIGKNTHTRFDSYTFLEDYAVNPIPDTYIWEDEFHVTFDTKTDTLINNQFVYSTYAATQPTEKLTKSGYEFSGWYETNPNTGLIINDSPWDFSLEIEKDMHFSALWIPVVLPSYHVIYEGNGNDGGVVPKDYIEYSKGDVVTILDGEPNKTGYDFMGWLYENTIYKVGQTISVKDSDIRLVAQWSEASEGEVVVKYVDKTTKDISDSVTLHGKYNDIYITNPKVIPNYTLINIPENANGKFSTEKQTVTYVYEANEGGNIVVKFIDTKGINIATSDLLSGKIGETYQTQAKSIPNYKLINIPENAIGEFVIEEQTVTYVYEEIRENDNVTLPNTGENNNMMFSMMFIIVGIVILLGRKFIKYFNCFR